MSESVVHTQGYISAGIDDRQDVGVAFGMDNVFYDKAFSNYSLVKLRPYYSVKTESVSLTAGVNVDFQISNAGGLKLSPDVRFDYTFADSYVLYAHVTGNTKLNDFGTINGFSPFWVQPVQLNTSYTPYDIKVGLKAAPLTGFGLGIYAGYRETRNELFSMPYADGGGIYNGIAHPDAAIFTEKVSYPPVSLFRNSATSLSAYAFFMLVFSGHSAASGILPPLPCPLPLPA